MNLIAKPSKENIKTYVPLGFSLVSLSILDVFVNAFFNFNLIAFLPPQLSYFLPLILLPLIAKKILFFFMFLLLKLKPEK